MEENKVQPNDKNIKVLRTYTSDMADVIREDEMSVIKIALAEKEKREQADIYKKAEGTNLSKTLLIIGGIIFIISAIVGSYFISENKKKDMTPPVPTNIDTFISYESSGKIDTTNMRFPSELTDAIVKEQSTPNIIKTLFIVKNANGLEEILSTKNFLSFLEINTPDTLVRSLSDKYILGKYSKIEPSTNKNNISTFLVFQTTNYAQSYASMLEWEKILLKDLSPLFGIDINSSNESLLEKQWDDIIINNKDARVLYEENGKLLLSYLFVDKNHFIITNSMDALKEVTTRIVTKNSQPQ